MRKASMILLLATLVAGGAQFAPSSAACTAGTKTAAGGQKDSCGDIHCGSKYLPTGTDIKAGANQTPNGAEVEGCSDHGAGNGQGRVVVQADSTHGARVVLDTDDEQPFDPGYITVEADKDGHSGVWCTRSPGTFDPNTPQDPKSASDGYGRSWSSPGTDGGLGPQAANCVPKLG